MSDDEAKSIEPESPIRLRECLSALARHSGCEVLRVEVAFGPSTQTDGSSLTMIVTHSLGAEHEKAIGPPLASAFGKTLRALALDANVRENTRRAEDVRSDEKEGT